MQACAKYFVAPALPEMAALPNLPGGIPVSPLPSGMISRQSVPVQAVQKSDKTDSSIIIPGSAKARPPSGGSGLIIPGH